MSSVTVSKDLNIYVQDMDGVLLPMTVDIEEGQNIYVKVDVKKLQEEAYERAKQELCKALSPHIQALAEIV